MCKGLEPDEEEGEQGWETQKMKKKMGKVDKEENEWKRTQQKLWYYHTHLILF